MGGGSNSTSEYPEIEIHQQTAFGDDGQLEVTGSSVETSLDDFGADVDHRERDSQIDRPEAEEFGVDDRPEVTRSTESDQSNLFAETADDQQTLTDDPPAEIVGLDRNGVHRGAQFGEFWTADGWDDSGRETDRVSVRDAVRYGPDHVLPLRTLRPPNAATPGGERGRGPSADGRLEQFRQKRNDERPTPTARDVVYHLRFGPIPPTSTRRWRGRRRTTGSRVDLKLATGTVACTGSSRA